MAAAKGISGICLIIAGLSVVMGLDVTIEKTIYEFARGDNITLPCNFKPKTEKNAFVIISWLAERGEDDPDLTILTYYSNTKRLDVRKAYESRATLQHDIPKGIANLKLGPITMKDNRQYTCKVQIPGDDEGKLADTTELVVLVAPSKPICAIQGKAEYGQNINLTCMSEEGSPPPTYSWQGHDVKNTPRANPARATDKNGVMSLYNISIETSGYYICTSANKIRSATCNVTVSVLPPSMNMGATAGIIGGCVAGALVLAVVVYFCCCRKKGKAEEYEMGVPEGGKEPLENGDGQRDDKQGDRIEPEDDSQERSVERRNRDELLSEKDDDRQSDYEDRRDRRDRSDRYSDRQDDYEDRDNYDDRRDRYDDRYDDRRDRYDDRSDRNDDRYDDRDRPPSVPPNKPSRTEYDD